MNQMGLKIRIMDGLVWVVEKGLGNGGLLIVLIQGATFVGGILKNIARIANSWARNKFERYFSEWEGKFVHFFGIMSDLFE